MSRFIDAARTVPPLPTADVDPRFAAVMRAVASGRMTVDEAWAKWVAERDTPAAHEPQQTPGDEPSPPRA